ncbi:MAG: hypothetical protein ACE5GW_07550 [Planctomycetota bacterium]
MADHPFLKEWHNQTTLHPLGMAAIVILGIAMLLLPRRLALVPLILTACFISPAQRIVVASLDFNLLRVMVLCGWMRLILRGELLPLRWKLLDTLLVLWALSGTIAYTVLHGSTSAFIFKLGTSFDTIGMYFLFRFLIRDWIDIERAVRALTWVSVPVALAFLVEWNTARNPFAAFGGVNEVTIMRDGALRCQGAFAHPILAGCFFASIMPWIAARWWLRGSASRSALVGLAASALVVLACNSSTPVLGVIVAAFAGCLYYFRHLLGFVRWLTFSGLVAVHFLREKPVWHLLSRVGVRSGSTGWHRYYLVDHFIRRFSEWWMVGTTSTAHWGLHLFDVTNQYVLEGVRGGILSLALFLLLIAVAFRGVGGAWRANRENPWRLALSWALGVSLMVHCVNFIAVSYFGQIIILWYLNLALIAALTPLAPARARAGARVPPAIASSPPRPRPPLPDGTPPGGPDPELPPLGGLGPA